MKACLPPARAPGQSTAQGGAAEEDAINRCFGFTTGKEEALIVICEGDDKSVKH